MDRTCIIFVIIVTTSSVLAQTRLQVLNRQIWNNYCSPAVRENTFSVLEAFKPICSAFSREEVGSCCDVVAQSIRSYPDMQLCSTVSGYHFNVAGCGIDLSSRSSFSDDITTESSDIRFPAEPQFNQVPETKVKVPGVFTGFPAQPPAEKMYEVVEIVFGNNPADNVRVNAPSTPPNRMPQDTAAPTTSGIFNDRQPTSNKINRQTSQQQQQYNQQQHQQQQQQHSRNPTPVESYNNGFEETPILLGTPGYQATEFALNMFKNLDRPTNGNSVISPLLPQQLLSSLIDVANPVARHQLQNAVRLYPEQLDALTKTLQRTSKATVNTIETATVNVIARDFKLNRTYEEAIRLRDVDVLRVDFFKANEAARTANKWVSDKTHRLINEIISPGSVDSSTRLLLANSVYFKGKWKYSFIRTEAGNFESSPGNKRQVSSMFQLNKLRYGELSFPDGNGFRWVELPYEGDTLAMLIFLPKHRHQLEASLRQLQPEDLAKVMAQTQSYIDTKVNLHLPKFTLTDSVSLIPTLRRLGVNSIFDDDNSLMYLSNEPTVVSDATQRSYLSVDELGTKATSVASFSIVTLSITPQYRDVQFNVDQPFLAMIVDKQERYPLFIAQIYEPRE